MIASSDIESLFWFFASNVFYFNLIESYHFYSRSKSFCDKPSWISVVSYISLRNAVPVILEKYWIFKKLDVIELKYQYCII